MEMNQGEKAQLFEHFWVSRWQHQTVFLSKNGKKIMVGNSSSYQII